MMYITGGLVVIFILVLIYFLFRLWLEGQRESSTSREIKGEMFPVELRVAALRPLKLLNEYYEKRDPENADACIDETMLADKLLIEQNRCAMACQGCDAIFSTFSKKGSDRIVPR